MQTHFSEAIFLCFVFSTVSVTGTGGVAASDAESSTQVCALYIAPSIVDENKLALFSGIDYDAFMPVGIDELVIPITAPNKNEDSAWHRISWDGGILSKLTITNTTATSFASGDSEIYDKSVPSQYETYSNFLMSGLGSSLVRCDGYASDGDVHLMPNVQFSHTRRQYELIGDTATSSSTSNIHNYGFVASKHGIRAGQEIILNCDVSASISDEEDNFVYSYDQADFFAGRDLEWIQQNGVCIDNFVIKDSSISHKEANRGAFAKRNMDVDSVVSISPVVHMDRSQLDIVHQQRYDDTMNNGKPKSPLRPDHGIEYNNTLVLGKQLLTNYVFGHPDSNMILLPMAPGVNFINHYRVMDVDVPTGKHLKPNVGIRWSNFAADPENLSIKLLRENTPIMELYDENVGTFVLEYYALEPIKEGDELFLDYGIEWEKAFLDYLKSGTSTGKPFRHEISVPIELYPRNWMRFDPKPDGDFIANHLEPNHLALIRWKNDATVTTPWAFRVSLPSSVRSTLLKYCNEMGITDILRHATVEGNGPNPGEDTHVKMPDDMEWFLQRTHSGWKSNLHWFSPADNKAHEHYLQALSVAGFDSTLKAVGQHLGMDGLVVFHLSFIAVSWCTTGLIHVDFRDTEAKGFNIIIPLILANDTGPELDLVSGLESDDPEAQTGRYRYEYDVGSMVGDGANHATSSCDYRTSKQFRMAATIYIADVNERNVDSLMSSSTQIYPPRDRRLFLSWAGRHWKPNDTTVQLPKPSAGHILVRKMTADSTMTMVHDEPTLSGSSINNTNYVRNIGSNNESWTEMNSKDQAKHELQTSSCNLFLKNFD